MSLGDITYPLGDSIMVDCIDQWTIFVDYSLQNYKLLLIIFSQGSPLIQTWAH
mgnify:CR=1 FL=1